MGFPTSCEARQILLIRDALIDRQERIECPSPSSSNAPFLMPGQPTS